MGRRPAPRQPGAGREESRPLARRAGGLGWGHAFSSAEGLRCAHRSADRPGESVALGGAVSYALARLDRDEVTGRGESGREPALDVRGRAQAARRVVLGRAVDAAVGPPRWSDVLAVEQHLLWRTRRSRPPAGRRRSCAPGASSRSRARRPARSRPRRRPAGSSAGDSSWRSRAAGRPGRPPAGRAMERAPPRAQPRTCSRSRARRPPSRDAAGSRWRSLRGRCRR